MSHWPTLKFSCLHIIRASHCLCLCAPTRRASFRPSFTCLLSCDCGPRHHRCVRTVSTISGHFSSQTLLSKNRQRCEFWREVTQSTHCMNTEFMQCVLWVIRLTKTVSWSAVLIATLWHCRELSDERYAHHSQCDFWVLQRLTPAVTDRPPPVLRRHQSVSSVPSTTPCANWLTACCSR